MESLNHTLFLWINAAADPSPTTVWLAMAFAEYAIWLAPLALVAGWLWGQPATRRQAFQTGIAAAVALLINAGFGLLWYHPGLLPLGWAPTCCPTWRIRPSRATT